MSGGPRSLPGHPSLRYLKLEAKRRLAAGEAGTLNDAQTAIAREHGLPCRADLTQATAPLLARQLTREDSMYQPYPGSGARP